MLEVEVPGLASFRLEHLVLDVNGTLALDGTLVPGIAERLERLRAVLSIHLLSADTHGGLATIGAELRVPAVRLRAGEPEAEQKAAYVRERGAASVIAVGNGTNDLGMLREAAVSIGVLGPEGLAAAVMAEADVLVGSPTAALDLLLHPKRLVATLRR